MTEEIFVSDFSFFSNYKCFIMRVGFLLCLFMEVIMK